MPEADALPSWRALANDAQLDYFGRRMVATQLARVKTLKAADLLVGMKWSPNQPPAQAAPVDTFLQDMYQGGDSFLKQYIEKLYAGRGQKMPNSPTLVLD